MLRSSNELLRYDVEAVDGAIGKVADFYFEDRNWDVRYIAVDPDGAFGDNTVLYAINKVRELKFPTEAIVLDVSLASAEESGGRELFGRINTLGKESAPSTPDAGDAPLRSLKAPEGFKVRANDGAIGLVHGFLIETAAWSIRYAIIETDEFLPGDFILMSPLAIERVDWDDRFVQTDVTLAAVKNCPPYDARAEVTRQYEAFLHDYYGWQKYWL